MNAYIRKVNYYECDRMGITHHSNYIRYMEEARLDLLEKLGYGFDRMEREGLTSPVVSLECRYVKPTTFNDELRIRVWMKACTGLKITFEYEMTLKGEAVCRASSTHCFMEGGRPVVIADRFPSLLEKLGGL